MTIRIAMRPVDDAPFLVPLIFTLKLDSTALFKRVNFVCEIDVMGD